MNATEAASKRDANVQLAKALRTVALRLVPLAKARLKAKGEPDDAVRQSARLLVTLGQRMAHHVEVAKLYDSFTKEVPEKTLTDRLR